MYRFDEPLEGSRTAIVRFHGENEDGLQPHNKLPANWAKGMTSTT